MGFEQNQAPIDSKMDFWPRGCNMCPVYMSINIFWGMHIEIFVTVLKKKKE